MKIRSLLKRKNSWKHFHETTETKTAEALDFVNYLITNRNDHLLSKERFTLRNRHNPKAKSFMMALRFFAEKYPNTRGAILALIKTDPSILEWHAKDSIDITYPVNNNLRITVELPTIEKRGPCYGVNSTQHGFKYIKVDAQNAPLQAATYQELNALFRQGVKDKQGYVNNLILYFHQEHYFTGQNADERYGTNIGTLQQEACAFVTGLLEDPTNYCREVRGSLFRPQGYKAKENITRSYCELLRFFIDTFGDLKPTNQNDTLQELIITTLNATFSDDQFNTLPGQNPLKYLSGKPHYINNTVGELEQNGSSNGLRWKAKS